METWDAIRSRRNVRDFEDRPVPSEHMDRILEAARRTPSSMNRQRWDLVVVTGRDELEQLAQVWSSASHVARSAATIGLVAPATDDRASVRYDLGQLTMSIMLAAADLGIGSGHAAVRNQVLARDLLGLPDDRELAMLIALGYPAGRPLEPIAEPDRRPLDDVVHRGTW
ncbi:MAG: nitroreductase family protein [Actinobacteria bacterium]|nr:nitroreductase family protein [Actinomycetota bacterium]